jgi:glutathione S-transferase
MTVDRFAEILEGELADAFEVKNAGSLHRAAYLIAENSVAKTEYQSTTDRMFAKLDENITATKAQFAQMDKRWDETMLRIDQRFEAVDKRFEDMNRRFTAQTWFMGIGFSMLGILFAVFNYL